jgi:endoglycosylceramidase
LYNRVVTEFGATDNLANLAGVLRQADEDRMGWLKWAYTGTTRPVRRRTSRHWSSTQPIADRQQRQYGQARRACRAIPAGDRRHAEGLVVQFRHLPASYVTRRLDGQGGFAPGAQTIVSVPPLSIRAAIT